MESDGSVTPPAHESQLGYHNDDSFDSNAHDQQTQTHHRDRPNRWQGTADEWRRLTRSERSLVESLDQVEDSDLSIQIYNTHALSRTSLKRDIEAEQYHFKPKWYDDDEWVPPREWTSWPDRYDYVPTEGETVGERALEGWNQDTSIKATLGVRPSVHIETELLSIMGRETNRMVRSLSQSDTLANNSKIARIGTSGSLANTDLATNDLRNERPADLFGETPAALDSLDIELEDANHVHSRTRAMPLQDCLPLADDDEINRKLRPSGRRIIRNLNCLLLSLNHARQNHYNKNGPTSMTKIADAGETVDGEGSGTDSAGGRLQSDMSESELSTVSSSADSETEFDDDALDFQKQGPRDWSEIISAAALCGWERNVLQRTKERCEMLFSEKMDIPDAIGAIGSYDSNTSKTIITGENSDVPTVKCDEPPPGSFACPFMECRQKRLWYTKRWRLNEHMRRKHPDYSGNSIEQGTAGSSRGVPVGQASQTVSKASITLHRDGFLQPIERQTSWVEGAVRRGYKRRSTAIGDP